MRNLSEPRKAALLHGRLSWLLHALIRDNNGQLPEKLHQPEEAEPEHVRPHCEPNTDHHNCVHASSSSRGGSTDTAHSKQVSGTGGTAKNWSWSAEHEAPEESLEAVLEEDANQE